MSRLIAFGCSLTYGDCLEDCIDFNQVNKIIIDNGKLKKMYGCGPQPSQYAWPSVLGKLLNIDQVVNKGWSGCSNKFIWKSIVDFKYQKDDLVFINWTLIDRYTSFGLDEDDSIHIGPWMNNKRTKHYYKSIYSDVDGHYDFYIRTDHAKKYLDSQGIKNFHTRSSDITTEAISKAPSWWNVEFLKSWIDESRKIYPLALDDTHPGPKAHEHFANDIYSEITGLVK